MQKRQRQVKDLPICIMHFDVGKNADLFGKKILLIDDVKTTGATLASIALTLKAYGASSVYCAVVAIVK